MMPDYCIPSKRTVFVSIFIMSLQYLVNSF